MRSFNDLGLVLALALGSLVVAPAAQAQQLEGCDKIEELVAAKRYQDALVEIDWCKRGVSELHFKRILEILEVPILGYDPGKGTVEGALGFNTVEITHSDGTNDVKTTFTSGTGGAESPMAGLGALSGLASAFGVRQAGVEEVRLGRTTGRLEEKSDDMYSLTATLKGGQVAVWEGPDGEFLQEFAIFVIRVLQDYLAG